MEGTNDITHSRPYDDIAAHLGWMVKHCKKYGSRPLLGTLIPRLDSLNDETAVMNGYIAEVADSKNVHLVDNWQAFYDYGDWSSLFVDNLHPNTQGMVVLSNSWYQGILEGVWWLNEETEPPTTWIESLPAQSECGQVTVDWNGSDNLSWVVDYDVQVQVNGGAWTDWLVATTATSAVYSSATYGDSVGFRVRGRDVVGNQSDYSTPAYTEITDADPPDEVQVKALPAAQAAPFEVRWSGADACGQVDLFDVEVRVGATGTWEAWQTSTNTTSAVFAPASPQYGQTYYFRVRARDEAGNWSDWSDPASTVLAQFTLSGRAFNVVHEPVAIAQFVVTDALAIDSLPGGYRAYVADAGDYSLRATRDGFGLLPAMHVLSVTSDLEDLDFVLPPLDDIVSDGGFEAGGWGDWIPGGSLPPTLVTETHTGEGAVLLGGLGGTSTLSQSFSVPGTLTNPTLSFLVRLDEEAGGSSTLDVELAGTPISQTQVVSTSTWLHVWLPVDAAVGQAVTLTLTLSDTPALRLDEVSLGSSRSGGSFVFLPLVLRAYNP
jgi:hypothetical protein